MNCTRCYEPLTPDTNVPIAGIEFCPDCSGYMRGLMNQYASSATYTAVTWHKQHKEEVAKLAAWNAWARGMAV